MRRISAVALHCSLLFAVVSVNTVNYDEFLSDHNEHFFSPSSNIVISSAITKSTEKAKKSCHISALSPSSWKYVIAAI